MKLLFVLSATLISGCGLISAETYSIDPAHSSAQFSVKHMMISNVQGDFSNVKGSIQYDPANLKDSSVKATVDTTTVNTHDPDRDKHLKSPDFFDITKFPQMNFESTEFVQDGDKLKIKGNLTLHGVTKAVTLDAEAPSPEVKDPWGNLRRGVSATTTVNRKDYGLVWNKNLDGGGVLVGDEVKVTLNVEGLRKP